jgi:hypothetical protein
MTKQERADLNRAIDLLYLDDGDGWDDGMEILARLAGRDPRNAELAKGLRSVSLVEMIRAARPARESGAGLPVPSEEKR